MKFYEEKTSIQKTETEIENSLLIMKICTSLYKEIEELEINHTHIPILSVIKLNLLQRRIDPVFKKLFFPYYFSINIKDKFSMGHKLERILTESGA